MKVQIIETVLKLNDQIAAANRARFRQAGLFAVNLIGSPGCGKTTLLETTLQHLSPRLNIAVIVGDLATARDGQRLGRFCDRVVQINTGKTCHLEAFHVQQALEKLPLDGLDILFIENVGNLICPVGFDLGQDVKVAMFSVSEGDDKPAKHPYLVQEADLLILNKLDLLPYVRFDLDAFRNDILRLKPSASILSVSLAANQGIEAWLTWLEQERQRRRTGS